MEPRIYLDYNSTSIIDANVVQLMTELLNAQSPYNPSSIHQEGRKARGIIEESRKQIANALNIHPYNSEWQIIFTSSGTESNNLVINNFLNATALIGSTEHVSILETNHPNKVIIPVNKEGIIEPEVFRKVLNSQNGPKIASIMLANNETGVIQDIEALVKIAHESGAIFHCDASQAFCKIEMDLNTLNCDLLTISSHKSGGPLGAAALIARKNLNLKPMLKGGKQEQGIRSGTENLIAIAGFGLAAQYFQEKIKKFKKIAILRDKMEELILQTSSETKVICKGVNRLPNTSLIRMPNVKSEEQLIKFDLSGVSISAGSACSSGRIAKSHVLEAMGIESNISSETIRISMGLQTTEEDIEKFIKLWKEIYIRGNS